MSSWEFANLWKDGPSFFLSSSLLELSGCKGALFPNSFCSASELLPPPSHTKVESPFWSLGSWLVPRLGLCLVSALNPDLTPVHLLRLLYYLLGTQGLHFFLCLSRRSPLTSSPDTGISYSSRPCAGNSQWIVPCSLTTVLCFLCILQSLGDHDL